MVVVNEGEIVCVCVCVCARVHVRLHVCGSCHNAIMVLWGLGY